MNNRIFTVSEASKISGVSRITLYQKINRGAIPTIKKDGKTYIKEQIVKLLKKGE